MKNNLRYRPIFKQRNKTKTVESQAKTQFKGVPGSLPKSGRICFWPFAWLVGSIFDSIPGFIRLWLQTNRVYPFLVSALYIFVWCIRFVSVLLFCVCTLLFIFPSDDVQRLYQSCHQDISLLLVCLQKYVSRNFLQKMSRRCCACTVLCCPVLYPTVLYRTVLYCFVLCCCTELYCGVLYCTVLYFNLLYCTLLCCTVL